MLALSCTFCVFGTEALSCTLYSKQWIAFEKVSWPEFKTTLNCWHYWKIFLIRNMMDPNCVPQHYVCILNFSVPVCPIQSSAIDRI